MYLTLTDHTHTHKTNRLDGEGYLSPHVSSTRTHTHTPNRLDGEGYLTLTGRIKELINRGGEKISPLEVCV